jgi:hypothetical protein
MPGPAAETYPLTLGPAAPDRFGPYPPGSPQDFGPDSLGPQDFGLPGAPQDPRGGTPARRKNRLLIAVAVVAVALLGGIAIIMTRHSGGTAAGQAVRSTPAGSQSSDAGTAGRGGKAAAHRRITTGMIFPRAHVMANGIKFGRVTAVLNKKCTLTARGAFASALTSAGCRRVARATFVDNGKRYAVTAGVAELPSPAAASRADRKTDFGRDVWFTGLDGPAHSGAKSVSKSVGLGYDVVYGRYIVYSLATYSSGQNPTGHAAAVSTLKDLAKSFAAMSQRPLTTHGK